MPRPIVRLWTSKKWMEKKYLREKLTVAEIAKLAGTDVGVISRWLERHGLRKKKY